MTDGASLLADIRWTCAPVPRPEQIGVDDLLTLDLDDLRLHVVDLREELFCVRALACQALALIAERDLELDTARRRQVELAEENHRYVRSQVTPNTKGRTTSYWT